VKRGHSNVVRLEEVAPYHVPPYSPNPDRALIPIVGGADVSTVRELPPLALAKDEWERIGRKMGWAGPDADLAIWFTPDAVREHEEEKGDEDVTLEGVTDADLREAGKEAPHDELLWKVVYPLLDRVAEEAREIAAKRAAGGAKA